MARNLILCCDGTNNKFGPENTNVVRLVQVLDRDPSKQRLYYDPGVGTLPEPGVWTALGKRLSEISGLAFGGGIGWKVEEAYTYLMNVWEPDDRVFLFGFSRGAYTVRVLAGLLHTLGLLPRGNPNLVPYVFRLFGSLRKYVNRQSHTATAFWRLCDDFRWTFARPVLKGEDDRRFHVHFMGLWDTVSSVGWVWDPPTYPYVTKNPSIECIRHAISIDERRWFFRQNLIQPSPDQDVQQLWFAGVHSDVGGGYPVADGDLWRMSFRWLLDGAVKSGLYVDKQRLAAVLPQLSNDKQPWNDRQHESLTPLWWAAEFFPKLQWRPQIKRKVPAIGLGRHRRIQAGATIHESTLRRLRETVDYRPPNLSANFVNSVKNLSAVTEPMLYVP
jgi:uncharacterized protein (DUF2235 family)